MSPVEQSEVDRATLESLRDSSEPAPRSSLSPTSALFHRGKPKSASKKSSKKARGKQVAAVKADELDVVSAADEPVQGADGVLDLADELLDQLELDESLGRRDATSPSSSASAAASPSHSSSPLDKAGAALESIGSKLSSGLHGGSSRQAKRKVRSRVRRPTPRREAAARGFIALEAV